MRQINFVISLILLGCWYFGGVVLADDTTVSTLDKNLPNKILHTLKGHKRNITSIAFSPDGKILASGSEDE
ncbi:MAG: hypothetical protein KAG43_03905, partial [Candidatus Marithrix sp.]|nr:hypothetical protein [Candidatus Marithrix sp.]